MQSDLHVKVYSYAPCYSQHQGNAIKIQKPAADQCRTATRLITFHTVDIYLNKYFCALVFKKETVLN